MKRRQIKNTQDVELTEDIELTQDEELTQGIELTQDEELTQGIEPTQDVELGWFHNETLSDVASSGGSEDGYEQVGFANKSEKAPPLPPRKRTTLLADKGADEETLGHFPLPGKDDSHSPPDGSYSDPYETRPKISLESVGHDEEGTRTSCKTDDADGVYGILPSDSLPSVPIETNKKFSAGAAEVVESNKGLGTFSNIRKVNWPKFCCTLKHYHFSTKI